MSTRPVEQINSQTRQPTFFDSLKSIIIKISKVAIATFSSMLALIYIPYPFSLLVVGMITIYTIRSLRNKPSTPSINEDIPAPSARTIDNVFIITQPPTTTERIYYFFYRILPFTGRRVPVGTGEQTPRVEDTFVARDVSRGYNPPRSSVPIERRQDAQRRSAQPQRAPVGSGERTSAASTCLAPPPPPPRRPVETTLTSASSSPQREAQRRDAQPPRTPVGSGERTSAASTCLAPPPPPPRRTDNPSTSSSRSGAEASNAQRRNDQPPRVGVGSRR